MIPDQFDETGRGFLPQSLIGSPCTSSREGIFFAGTATGPKTLPETLSEADAAALAIDRYLKSLQA